jgi:hypothetical protein
MRLLLTIVAWGAISFLFSWLWGTAISRGDSPADASSTS